MAFVLDEIILTAIVDAVISHALDKGAERLGDRICDIISSDPTKKAFKEALIQAFKRFDKQHSEWVATNFDASFFQTEAAPILAEFLVMNGQPDASELAARWADSLNLRNQRRAFYISELEPIAADFLEDLASQLKRKDVLRKLNISRATDQATESLQALRRQFGADKATYGTRRDYLRWLIGRNVYLVLVCTAKWDRAAWGVI